MVFRSVNFLTPLTPRDLGKVAFDKGYPMTNSSIDYAFERFAYGLNGSSFIQRLHAMARHYISGHVAKIDPNWHRVEIEFEGKCRRLEERSQTELEACRVEFCYRPSSVVLVGPKVGHVLLIDRIFEMIPGPLLALVRMSDVIRHTQHTLYNPKHNIELIDGKTIIGFEICTDGVVRNVRGDEFDVEGMGCGGAGDFCPGDFMHYTRSRLLEELKSKEEHGQACDIDYLPYLPYDGRTFNTAEEVVEARQQARTKQLEELRAEQEQQRREEAAAYEALSPEKKAAHDVEVARMRETAERFRSRRER